MSKPTAGNLRGAKALFGHRGPAESWYVRADQSLNELGEILDETNGLPELVKACKMLILEIGELAGGRWTLNVRDFAALNDRPRIVAARAAIAKATEKEKPTP